MTRILAPLLFGLAGIGILLSLGNWQLNRLEWKRGILDEIEATIGGSVRALPETPDPALHKYQPVAIGGVLEPEEIHILVSVKQRGAVYRIISAMQSTTSGRRVLIDRGFVPTEDKNTPRWTGLTVVEGNLHWPDDRNSSTPANDVAGNIWFARDIDAMAKVLNTEPLLIIARSELKPDPGLTLLPVDTAGIPNDHLQYAITWFSLAVVWLIMTAALIWRQLKGQKG